MNLALFVSVTICWGMTWFAIHLQVGKTPVDVAIFWRFFLASILLFGYLLFTGGLKPVQARAWKWIMLLGACLFSFNFMSIYGSEKLLPSGAVSVIFSMASVFNVFNQWLFFKIRPDRRSLLGAAFGVAGVALMAEGQGSLGLNAADAVLPGIGLALMGTFSFSIGSMISRKVSPLAPDMPNIVLRGMACGSVIMAAIMTFNGHSPAFPSLATTAGQEWFGGLLYLSIFGSIVGFITYLLLASRIGSDRAAYATVLSPVIALALSSLFEDAHWGAITLFGLGLILLGNVIVFARRISLRRQTPISAVS